MTRVAILPVEMDGGVVSYRAVSGDRQSLGRTAGEALDALTALLPEPSRGTMVVVQGLRPDRFFDAEAQRRLADLMGRWRDARDSGTEFPRQEQDELESLIEAETLAATARASALADEVGR